MKSRKSDIKATLFIVLVIAGLFITGQLWAAQSCIEYDVEMRDGVELYTRVFLPDPAIWGPGPYPAILTATPYGVAGYTGRGQCSNPSYIPNNDQAAHGYAYVYQDTRGRYLSGGVWTRRDDGHDGYDTVEWIAQRPWSIGKIGMGGLSAMGLTTYMTAGMRPPHLVAIAPSIASANALKHFTFEGQALQFETTLAWRASNVYNGLSQSHYDSLALTPAQLAAAKADVAAVYADVMSHLTSPTPLASPSWMRLPLYNFPGISPLLPSWNETLMHPSSQDPYYDPFNVENKIKIPGLHMGGWYDIYGRGIVESYMGIEKNIGKQKLLMTNKTHMQFAYAVPMDAYYKWFDYWLKGLDNDAMDEPSVSYFRMLDTLTPPGTGEWLLADQWPLPDVSPKTLYLHSNGKLSDDLPGNAEGPRLYTYDPKAPLPTLGGRNLYITAGAKDQRDVEPPKRTANDVLLYTSDVLPSDMEVSGKVKVVLHASSNCRDTDFVAKLIDVYPDGRAMLILDSVIRARYRDSLSTETLMTPNVVYEFNLDLGDTSQVFKAGHRIQIDISSCNFPIRDRNTNTGNASYVIDDAEDVIVANNTIYHNAANPSYVVLPVVTPKTRIFAGNARINMPGISYDGPAALYTLGKGVYLYSPNALNAAGRHWIKWDLEKHWAEGAVEHYKGQGKYGPVSVLIQSNPNASFNVNANGEGIHFRSNGK